MVSALTLSLTIARAAWIGLSGKVIASASIIPPTSSLQISDDEHMLNSRLRFCSITGF